MTPEQRRRIASLGGRSVPKEKRNFSNPERAAAAGRIGGVGVPPEKRTFSDKAAARRAGRTTRRSADNTEA